MDFAALEKNIVGVVSEQQIKLGYRSEVVRLYYPLDSLNRILRTEDSQLQMRNHLEEFCGFVEERLGRLKVDGDGNRFCLAVPPRGSDYIHACAEKNEFLHMFIETIRRHGCTIDDILAVFQKFSPRVHMESAQEGEYDYLLYFEDGEPDDYRYCLTREGGHLTYHRFTEEDFESF